MVELILLLILVTIGILWFRNLSDNSEKGNDEDSNEPPAPWVDGLENFGNELNAFDE